MEAEQTQGLFGHHRRRAQHQHSESTQKDTPTFPSIAALPPTPVSFHFLLLVNTHLWL